MPRTQQLPELIRGPTDDPTVLATGSWAESDWYAVPAAPRYTNTYFEKVEILKNLNPKI